MNVWIRVWAVFYVDSGEDERVTEATIKPDLHMTVFRTKEQAELARQRAGGIILEVDAKSLSDLNEFGKDIYLVNGDDTQDGGKTLGNAHISVSCVAEAEPGTLTMTTFSSDEEAWLDDFADQTGFHLSQ